MKRGEVWTVAGGGDFSGKPRPAVILQDDRFSAIESITVCLITSEEVGGFVARIPLEPDDDNGLKQRCYIMVDKVTTLRRARLGARLGELGLSDMKRLNAAVITFLGLGTDVSRRPGASGGAKPPRRS